MDRRDKEDRRVRRDMARRAQIRRDRNALEHVSTPLYYQSAAQCQPCDRCGERLGQQGIDVVSVYRPGPPRSVVHLCVDCAALVLSGIISTWPIVDQINRTEGVGHA